MATFPASIPISFKTRIRPDALKRPTVMKDHSFVIQKDSSVAVYSGTIICIHLTDADKTTIENFYTANEDISWDFFNPQDEETYTLYFTQKPYFYREQREASILFICELQVIGNIQ